MLALAAMTMTVAAMVVLFPETPAAKALNGWLIDAPARWLNRTAVWRSLFYAGLIAGGVLATVLLEAEGLLVYRAMASEVVIWSMMFDVGLVIDALLISAAMMATNGLRMARMRTEAVIHRVIVAVRRTGARARHAAVVRPRPIRKPADDDRPAWGLQPAYRAFSMA